MDAHKAEKRNPGALERVARWSRMLAEASRTHDSKIENNAREELAAEFAQTEDACRLIQHSAEVIADTLKRFDSSACTDPTCMLLHCAQCGKHVDPANAIEADEQVFCSKECFDATEETNHGA